MTIPSVGAYTNSGDAAGQEALASQLGYQQWVSDYIDDTSPSKMSTSANYPAGNYIGIPNLPGIMIGVPILWTGFPGTAGSPDTAYPVSAVVSGTYDSDYNTLFTYLQDIGVPIIIRLGWEFNGGTMCWANEESPGSSVWTGYTVYTGFIALFQHVSTLAHNYSHFKVCWNPVLNTSYSPDVTLSWPGVYNSSTNPGGADIIGVDAYPQLYETVSGTNPTEPGYWNTYLSQSLPFSAPGSGLNAYGLDWFLDFANYHGLPLIFPEFGGQAQTGSWPGEGGTGDDTYWVSQTAEWISTNLINNVTEYPNIILWEPTLTAANGFPNMANQVITSFGIPPAPPPKRFIDVGGKRMRLKAGA